MAVSICGRPLSKLVVGKTSSLSGDVCYQNILSDHMISLISEPCSPCKDIDKANTFMSLEYWRTIVEGFGWDD